VCFLLFQILCYFDLITRDVFYGTCSMHVGSAHKIQSEHMKARDCLRSQVVYDLLLRHGLLK
jgi:hypothetical protein